MATTVQIQFFGRLVDLTGANNTELPLNDKISVQQLIELLTATFPSLTQGGFSVAINHELADSSTQISPGDQVALLPPFAGG